MPSSTDITNNNNNNDNNSNSINLTIKHFKSLLDDLKRQFSQQAELKIAIVSVSKQRLYLTQNLTLLHDYPISTAEAGIGNQSGSFQTPLGAHRIAEKFGENAPFASIFKARQNTHKIADIILNPNLRSTHDNITSRILWLDGLEQGVNKGLDEDKSNVDSYARYIYIHGTDEEGLLGKPASHGCIRMANHDVIELFDHMRINDVVVIVED